MKTVINYTEKRTEAGLEACNHCLDLIGWGDSKEL